MAKSQPIPIEEIIKTAEKLPPFPTVIWQVTSLLRKMAPIREIEAVIRYDQAIAAKVLTTSRSAFYSRTNEVCSLRDAIVVLGDKQLASVVMAACASRYFESEISCYELKEGELWEHSVASAIVAEKVANRLGKEKMFTIYTAALLHDIGKAVLSFHMKSYFDAILARMSRNDIGFLDAERQTLGIDHQELGKLIARRWNFPPEVIAGIGFHHSPSNSKEHREIAYAVYVANQTASALGFGCGIERLIRVYETEIFDSLGISTDMVPQFWQDMTKAGSDIRHFLTGNNSQPGGNGRG